MDIVNMKKVGNTYEPDSVDMDPFSEYVHPTNTSSTRSIKDDEQVHVHLQEDPAPLQGIDKINKNIDDFFDGVDMFFNLTDRVIGRIGGKNAGSRHRIK